VKRIFRLLLLVALAALGYWLWTVFFPYPERVIRNRIEKAARLASFAQSDGNISRIAAIQQLGTFMADELELKIDIPNYETHTFTRREELTQAAMGAKGVVQSLKIDFPDINVNLAPDKLSATADVTLRVDVNGQKDAAVQELRIYFRKVDGNWLVYRLDTLRTLH